MANGSRDWFHIAALCPKSVEIEYLRLGHSLINFRTFLMVHKKCP
jgi:hypothetical protein